MLDFSLSHKVGNLLEQLSIDSGTWMNDDGEFEAALEDFLELLLQKTGITERQLSEAISSFVYRPSEKQLASWK